MAQQALAAQRREQALAALVRQAQEYLQAGAYQDALEVLAHGVADYAGDQRLIDLQTTVESAKAQWERAAAISKLAERSRQHVAQKEFEEAIALLELALSEYPAEPSLEDALKVARAELAAGQRDEAIEDACRLAQQQLEAGACSMPCASSIRHQTPMASIDALLRSETGSSSRRRKQSAPRLYAS